MSKKKIIVAVICFSLMNIMLCAIAYKLIDYENDNTIFFDNEYVDIPKGEYFLFIRPSIISKNENAITKSYLFEKDGDKVFLNCKSKSNLTYGSGGRKWQSAGVFYIKETRNYSYICENNLVASNFCLVPTKYFGYFLFGVISMIIIGIPLGGITLYCLKDIIISCFKKMVT